MAFIFHLSSRPDVPGVADPDTLPGLLIAKALHLAEYAVLAGLLWRALGRNDNRRANQKARPFVWVLAVSCLFALSDEWHQTFVSGREGTMVDVIIDCLGALLALVGMWRWKSRTTNRFQRVADHSRSRLT